MRTRLLVLSILIGLLAILAVPALAASAAELAANTAALAAQQPPQIDVDVNEGGEAWYTDPVWLVLGVIALVVLVLLIAAATRRRGRGTVIRQ